MPSPPPALPRSWSCLTARSDWALQLPLGPTLSFCELADGANERAGLAPSSLAVRASDSPGTLLSGVATRSLVDSHTLASLRRPERFVHPTGDPLDCLAVFSGSTSSIG